MNLKHYPLRARSDRGTWVSFSIEDAPCPIDEDSFFLMNRPGTPILLYSTIMHGLDIPNLYEGDIVLINRNRYIVSHANGYKAVSLRKKSNIIFDENLRYKVISNIYREPDIHIETTIKNNYKFHSLIFGIDKIYGSYKECLIVNMGGGLLLPIDEIQQDARFSYEGKKIFFGDELNGGEVCLKNGRLCIKQDTKFTDINLGGNKNENSI